MPKQELLFNICSRGDPVPLQVDQVTEMNIVIGYPYIGFLLKVLVLVMNQDI